MVGRLVAAHSAGATFSVRSLLARFDGPATGQAAIRVPCDACHPGPGRASFRDLSAGEAASDLGWAGPGPTPTLSFKGRGFRG